MPNVTRSLGGPRSSSCFLCVFSSSSNRLRSRESSLWCCSSLKLKKKWLYYILHTSKGPKWAITFFTDFKNKNCEVLNTLIKFYSSVFCGYCSDIHDKQHQHDRCVQVFLLLDEAARGPKVSVTKNLCSHPGQPQPERFFTLRRSPEQVKLNHTWNQEQQYCFLIIKPWCATNTMVFLGQKMPFKAFQEKEKVWRTGLKLPVHYILWCSTCLSRTPSYCEEGNITRNTPQSFLALFKDEILLP